jgi:hypothetical protein
MGPINAINDRNGRNQCHHCEAPKRSRDKRPANLTRRVVAMRLGATRRPHQQTRQWSSEDVVSITTILIPQRQSLSKERQLPRQKHDECKQKSGGPLNRKPQADWAYSCLRSPVMRTSRTTTKHEIKNLCTTIKKQPRDTWATRHTRDTHWTSDAHDRLTPSRTTTKQAQAAMTTTKTKITIFILIKKIKGRLCCCGSLCKTDHRWPSRVKRAKRKRRFLHFWTTISNFTDTILMGIDSMDADLKIGLMMLRIHSILTNDGPLLVELVEVPRVQKISWNCMIRIRITP